MSGSKTSLHTFEEEKKSGMDIEIEETLIYVGKRIRVERERLNLTREDNSTQGLCHYPPSRD